MGCPHVWFRASFQTIRAVGSNSSILVVDFGIESPIYHPFETMEQSNDFVVVIKRVFDWIGPVYFFHNSNINEKSDMCVNGLAAYTCFFRQKRLVELCSWHVHERVNHISNTLVLHKNTQT